MSKPLCIDLFCGLGGWADGFLAEGYEVIGFDIERHDYGTGGYPGQLVLQDVLTLHGSQFKDAAVIVASPPCQEYSYMAMPWTRAKTMAREYRSGVRSTEELNALFKACFRIAEEAGVPLILENVRGAQPWVGPARWNYGSFYLWGDVPALMPSTFKVQKFNPDGTNHGQGSWFAIADSKNRGEKSDPRGYASNGGSWFGLSMSDVRHGRPMTPKGDGLKGIPLALDDTGTKVHLSGRAWYAEGLGSVGSKSNSRKAASAQIAKIPFPLARHIARVFKP